MEGVQVCAADADAVYAHEGFAGGGLLRHGRCGSYKGAGRFQEDGIHVYSVFSHFPAHPSSRADGVGESRHFISMKRTHTGLGTCTQLVLDATGDLVRSDALVLYGALNCNNGVYGVTGSVFTASDATLHITMMVAGYTVSCPRIAGYAGNCTVYDADWVSRGTGVIQLL